MCVLLCQEAYVARASCRENERWMVCVTSHEAVMAADYFEFTLRCREALYLCSSLVVLAPCGLTLALHGMSSDYIISKLEVHGVFYSVPLCYAARTSIKENRSCMVYVTRSRIPHHTCQWWHPIISTFHVAVEEQFFLSSCGVLVGLSLHCKAFQVTISVRPVRDLFTAY